MKSLTKKVFYDILSKVEKIKQTSKRKYLKVKKEVVFEENSNLKTVGEYTFYACSKLKSVNLENCTKLENLSESMFAFCSWTIHS